MAHTQAATSSPLRLPVRRAAVHPWSILVVAITGILSIPVLVVFSFVFQPGGETWDHLMETVLADYVVNSVSLMLGVAAGTLLLGVKVVIADSYERIHRSNLIGMGVLPLQFPEGENADSIGLDGTESFDIPVGDDLKPGQTVRVTATRKDGSTVEFDALCRLDTDVEVEYYRHGGILHYVLRDLANKSPSGVTA